MLDFSFSSSLQMLCDFDLILDIFCKKLFLFILPARSEMGHELNYQISICLRNLFVLPNVISAQNELSLFCWKLGHLTFELGGQNFLFFLMTFSKVGLELLECSFITILLC